MACSPNLGSDYRVVGIAEMAVTNRPAAILATHCLGACLGVAVYDPVAKVGGLLHAMLPESRLDPVKARLRPGLFLDTGLRLMIEEILKLGADSRRLRLMAAGAAELMDTAGSYAIGARNHQALLRIVGELGLELEAVQIGGRDNRSLMLHLSSGEVWMKMAGLQKSVLLCKNSTTT